MDNSEKKQPQIKIKISITNEKGGFGFSLAQLLGIKMLIDEKGDPMDSKNFDIVYQALNEENKTAIDNYLNYFKSNPQIINNAREQKKKAIQQMQQQQVIDTIKINGSPLQVVKKDELPN